MSQDNIISLLSGQRYTVKSGCFYIQSGTCEVYAVTKNEKKHRQLFLAEMKAGNVVFPADDEFVTIDIMVYATEDLAANIIDIDLLSPEEYRKGLKAWFLELSNIDLFQDLAEQGDDVIAEWSKDDFLDQCNDSASLKAQFVENAGIASMLLGVKFKAQDKILESNVSVRQLYKRQLLDKSVGNLLLEDGNDSPDALTLVADKKNSDVVFIVRQLAANLRMPQDQVNINPSVAKKLDQLGVIKRLITRGNMQMRLVSLVDEWYKADCGTLLAYYGENKTLAAVLPVDESHYKLVTYENPEGIMVDEQVAAQIDKDGFQIYAGMPARKLKVVDLIKFMIDRCWKRDYVTIILCSLVAGFIPIFSPIITETLFSDIIPMQDKQSLVSVTQIMLLTGFGTASMGLVRSIAVLRITNHLDMNVEAAMWGRLLHLPMSFFRKFTSGEILSRMNGIESVKSFVTGEFVGSVFNLVFSFWSIFLMAWYSMKLTAMAMAVWFVYFIFVGIIYRQIISYQRKIIDAGNKLSGIIQQLFNGLAKFRVRGAEEQAFYLWTKHFAGVWKWNLKLRWQNNYTSIICSIQPFILTLMLYYMAVYGMETTQPNGQVVEGMTYAQFMAFQSAFSSFNGTLTGVIPLVAKFFMVKPQIDNLRPILEEEPEVTEDKIDADVLTGNLEVKHLSFAYGEGKKNVLDDISFTVNQGEKIAIVGRSGCGKSTLMKLIIGMEKPSRGGIYFDKQDVSELNMASVRSQLGVVMQNGQLMTGDIFTNIVGTSSTLTQDDAWEAAEMAGMADDIREMPMGMFTVVSEGSNNISGGQRQRLMIARAISNKPVMLILDEATSALDNRTQAIVTSSLEKMKCTQIIVAHRLSTIENADRILLIDGGKVAEEGSYDELMALNGKFAMMAQRQMA